MKKKIGLVIISLIVIMVALNILGQIFSTVKSGDRVSREADALDKLQMENRHLQQKLAQVKMQQFTESQARDKLGLAKKGETVIIIPDEKIKQVLGVTASAQVNRLPNWLGWWKVFF